MNKLIVIFRLAAQLFCVPVDRLNGNFNDYLTATRGAGFHYTNDKERGRGQKGDVANAPALVEALTAAGFRVELDAAARSLIADKAATEVNPADRSATIKAELAKRNLAPFGFQYEGINYLADHDRALLHDDMGLGKSMQVALAIPKNGCAVVVCPAVVKGGWAVNEIPLWRPDLKATQLKGRNSFRWPRSHEELRAEVVANLGDCCACPSPLHDHAGLDQSQKSQDISARVEHPTVLREGTQLALHGTDVNKTPERVEPIDEGLVGIPDVDAPSGGLRPDFVDRPIGVDHSGEVANEGAIDGEIQNRPGLIPGTKSKAPALKDAAQALAPRDPKVAPDAAEFLTFQDPLGGKGDLIRCEVCPRCSHPVAPNGEVVVTNYDILTDAAKLKDAPEGCKVIGDEAHYAKNNKAARTKRFRALGRKALKAGGSIWLLTGTPLLNRPLDLWAMLQAADLGKAAFGSFDNFMRVFNGYRGHFGIEWEPMSADQTEEAAELLARVAFGRRKAAVLKDLPAKRYETLVVDGKKGLAALNSFQKLIVKQGFKVLDDGTVLNAKGAPASLEDFTGNRIVFENISTMRSLVASAKSKALMELVESHEEAEEPLIVFADHIEPLDGFRDREGWGVIDGSVPAARRTEIVAAFQAGELRGVAGTRAMAEGITLTRASHMIFVERFWNPGTNAQAEDRNHRLGQSNACLYTTLVIDHPIDYLIANILQTKQGWTDVIDAAADDMPAPEAPKSKLAAVLDLPTYVPPAPETETEQAADEPEAPGTYQAVLDLFALAKEKGAKYPKFFLQDANGDSLRLEFINSGKNGGGVNVTSEGYGSIWFGRIERTGKANRKLSGAPTAVLTAIDAFAVNPARFAELYGKAMGCCCFCAKELDRLESYERGYGPVCADKYGLAFDHVRYAKGEQAPHVRLAVDTEAFDAFIAAPAPA